MAVERNYFSSEKLLFFPRSFIYFDFGKNRARGGDQDSIESHYYLMKIRVKFRIYLSSGLTITTTTITLGASHVSFSFFRIELLRNPKLGFLELRDRFRTHL